MFDRKRKVVKKSSKQAKAAPTEDTSSSGAYSEIHFALFTHHFLVLLYNLYRES